MSFAFQGNLYRTRYDLAREIVTCWITQNGANEIGSVREYLQENNDYQIINEMYENDWLHSVRPYVSYEEIQPILLSALVTFREQHGDKIRWLVVVHSGMRNERKGVPFKSFVDASDHMKNNYTQDEIDELTIRIALEVNGNVTYEY